MPAAEKENPRERDLVLKHQHSFSESGRLPVPMWDSADPGRAPPPLPLNPVTNSPATRLSASATIQAAAAALTEKANENSPSPYTTNQMSPSKQPSSPEKSLIKGQYHKRMQSLHNSSSARELASYLERRSPDKTTSTTTGNNNNVFDSENRSKDRSPGSRAGTPTPSGRNTPSTRPTSRYLSKPILGESTPPSATMLALQTMQVPSDLSESPVAIGSKITTENPHSPPQRQSFEALSAQIRSLTTIATSLQDEMFQLSRRSKDNATDLLSLKAATNSRDEDIRKSLKELSANLTSKFIENTEASTASRATPFIHHSVSSPFLIDSTAHDASPGLSKSYTLPRIPSPNSFAAAIERELTASPSTIATDGSASIALLEKVLREMATKEKQELLVKLLDEIKSRPTETNTDRSLSKMLEEVLQLLKQASSTSGALVRSKHSTAKNSSAAATNPQLELGYDLGQSRQVTRARSAEPGSGGTSGDGTRNSNAQPGDLLSEDILAILKRVKNSVAESGGLTNEVKALVRELRGEVLGMGREIAKKLEQVEASHSTENEEDSRGPRREDIAEIVESGLRQLQQHMEHVIRENRRQSSASHISRSTVDSQEVFVAVQKAVSELRLPEPSVTHVRGSGLEKEEILDAVREAWETYKPEIELQNFGLEREEILECLSQGLKEYRPRQEAVDPNATYNQVLEAVERGLQDFIPPKLESEPMITRDEIISTVRECLEAFEWPMLPNMMDKEPNLNRDDVVNAVKECLAAHDSQPKEIELNQDDLFATIKSALEDASGTVENNNIGEHVLEQFHAFLLEVKDEFKQYSAANGRDTEQVLDAVKDGLEVLRGEIESYVDRVSDVTGKDEIIDTVKDGFRLLQSDLEKRISDTAAGSRQPETVELLDAMEKEFEHLRQTLSNLLIRNSVASEKDEILDAIRDISDPERSNSDVSNTVKEEFQHLRETLSMAIMKPSTSLEKDDIISALKESFESLVEEHLRRRDGGESIASNTSELLDAFQDGVEILRSDMEKLLKRPDEISSHQEALDAIRNSIDNLKFEIDRLHEHQREADEVQTARGREIMLTSEASISHDLESLKVLVTQLQIKIESMDKSASSHDGASEQLDKDGLATVMDAIKEVQGILLEVASFRETPTEQTAKKEDTNALETLLRNTKAKIDELADSDFAFTAERIDAVEAAAKDIKDLLEGLMAHVETEGSTKSDMNNLESLVKDLWVTLDDLKSNFNSVNDDPERLVKDDVQSLETMVLDIKTQIDELELPDPKSMPTKEDLNRLSKLVLEFKEKAEAEDELTAQAFESRKIEHGGLAEKIEDAKGILVAVRDEFKNKLANNGEGIGEIRTMLECVVDSVGSVSKTEQELKDLSELIEREFKRARDENDVAKVDAEERDSNMLAKQDELRAAITVDLGDKFEEKFNEVISKYEDGQLLADSKLSSLEERDIQTLQALTTTHQIAEDIKLVVGAMGNSVTEACDRMNYDARTFFDRVDRSFSKVDSMQDNLTEQRSHISGQFEKTLAATSRLEDNMGKTHSEILSTVKDILLVVGEHFDHSRKSTEQLKTDVSAIPLAIPSLLPALPANQPPQELSRDIVPAQDNYGTSQVHDKLDTLINHATDAATSISQIGKLDEIHQQVMATAREIGDMVATQSRLMAEDHENKKAEAQETAVALEKRLAQKERVEAEVIELNEEKEAVLHAVHALKQEKEDLLKQSMKLSREVSGLETALKIRREEMQLMEERAEELERRIVEGVLDHARSLLVTRSSSSASASQAMNLKRVASGASTVTRGSVTSTARDTTSTVSSSVGMALKRRTATTRHAPGSSTTSPAAAAGRDRRILSHSHITGNRGATTDSRSMLSTASSGGLSNLKRSHSVKTAYPMRKASWDGRGGGRKGNNKENEVFKEEDENEQTSEGESDAGTERRSSRYTDTYADSNAYADSVSYGTGSTVSSSTNRTVSYSSSTNGLVAAEPGGFWVEDSENEASQDERNDNPESSVVEGEDHQTTLVLYEPRDGEEAPTVTQQQLLPPPPLPVETYQPSSQMAIYGHARHSDSGLGTDMPSSASEKGFAFGHESVAS